MLSKVWVKTMIRDKAFYCKLFSQKDHPADRLDRFMKSFKPARATCPCCHAHGTCRSHAYYSRYLIGLVNGKPVCRRVKILRVFCTSCRHTHAILPDFIIPFRQYSLQFILKVLDDYFTHRSPSRILREYEIDIRQLTAWRKLFQNHKAMYLGVLANKETTEQSFLSWIAKKDSLSDFLGRFYDTLKQSFLQSHANPKANSDGCALSRTVSGDPTTQLCE